MTMVRAHEQLSGERGRDEVRIVLTGHGRGEVHVNGTKLPRVRRIWVTAEAGDLNRVCVELIPTEIEISSFESNVKKFVAALGGEKKQ